MAGNTQKLSAVKPLKPWWKWGFRHLIQPLIRSQHLEISKKLFYCLILTSSQVPACSFRIGRIFSTNLISGASFNSQSKNSPTQKVSHFNPPNVAGQPSDTPRALTASRPKGRLDLAKVVLLYPEVHDSMTMGFKKNIAMENHLRCPQFISMSISSCPYRIQSLRSLLVSASGVKTWKYPPAGTGSVEIAYLNAEARNCPEASLG